jgi:peptide/nickel transport system permease protein
MAEISDTGRGAAGAARARSSVLAEGAKVRKPRTLWSDAWRQFRKHKMALTGVALLAFIILACLVGPLIYTKNPAAQNIATESLAKPSLAAPMGYNDLGQDMLARVLIGGRRSLLVGLMAVIVSITVGTLIGALAGFFGKFVDSALMRTTDLFLALPQLPLLLLISFLYVNKLKQTFGVENGILLLIVCVIGFLNWMPVARLVRASFLSLKEKEFVEAARCIGATTPSLIFKHLLPNVLSPVIVAATLGVGAAIIAESTLSFLGLGFPPDVPTWGSMLFAGKDYLEFAPHVAVFPGLMIFLVVLSINYIGDGLRDALDPRSRI